MEIRKEKDGLMFLVFSWDTHWPMEIDSVLKIEWLVPQPFQPNLTSNREPYKQLCTFYSIINTVKVDPKAVVKWVNEALPCATYCAKEITLFKFSQQICEERIIITYNANKEGRG